MAVATLNIDSTVAHDIIVTESHPSPPVPADFFCTYSHCSGKTGNLLKIPHITNSLVSLYTDRCISLVCLNTVCTPKFFTAEFVDHSRGVPAENKIHPRGNLAIARSIPAVFPQHSNPYPRETRGFRGIPAVPIPMHTSNLYSE